jgi:hypothetical protein
MKYLRALFVVAVIWSLAIPVFSNPPRDVTLTITLLDGTEIEGSVDSFNKTYKVLSVFVGTEIKKLNVGSIASIVNAQGEDVTEDIIGRKPRSVDVGASVATDTTGQASEAPSGDSAAVTDRPDETVSARPPVSETWLSESDPAVKKARKPLWTAAFRLSPNTSFPIGQFYDGYEQGFGFEGDLKIAITRSIALRALFATSGASPDDPFQSTINRFYIAIEYYRLLNPASEKLSHFYVYTGLGVAYNKLSLGQVSVDLTKPAVPFAVGTVLMASKSIGLDLSASLDIIYLGRKEGEDYFDNPYGETAALLDLRIGLVFLIPSRQAP